eukprot:962410-Amphidinium_carterae.5
MMWQQVLGSLIRSDFGFSFALLPQSHVVQSSQGAPGLGRYDGACSKAGPALATLCFLVQEQPNSWMIV